MTKFKILADEPRYFEHISECLKPDTQKCLFKTRTIFIMCKY